VFFAEFPMGFVAKTSIFLIWSYGALVKFNTSSAMGFVKVLPFMISYKRQRTNDPTPK
jgi:hypothetical protein